MSAACLQRSVARHSLCLRKCAAHSFPYPFPLASLRTFSSITRGNASAAAAVQQPEDPSSAHNDPISRGASRPLSAEQKQYLDGALRVNQAGELAAVLIYAAQSPLIIRRYPHLRALMQHMYDQEAGHLHTFNSLLAKHRIRPTLMYPIWRVAATALGWGTAVLGREAAMACTEAVETEIGQHYNDQVRSLLEWARQAQERGEELGAELTELTESLRRIRDEELEHLDHAVENDAKNARPYELLTSVIRGGCRGAIWVSERI